MSTIDKTAADGSTALVGRKLKRHSALVRQAVPFAVLIVLLAVVALLQPAFMGGTGLPSLFYQATPILLLALGQACVLLIGGIDLSAAAIAILCAVVLAHSLPALGGAALPLAIGVGALAGLVNGVVATLFQVPAFAVTLGTLGALQALSLILSNQTTAYVSVNGGVITWLVDYTVAGLSLCVWLSLLLAATLWAVVQFTRFGSNMRAVGLNERGAILSALPTKLTKVLAYVLSGAFAATAGIVLTAQQGTASASGLGIGLLLPSIAAAVVGGVAVTGGVGNPIAVVAGALIVALIPVGSSVIGVPPVFQQIVYGIIVILAVLATINRSKLIVVK